MKFNLTPDDFLKGKLVTPGWHPCEIVGYEEKTSKEKVDANGNRVPPSMYVELKLKIVAGKESDVGVVLYQNFSEKAPGFIVPFLEAISGKTVEKKPQEITFTKEKLVGQKIDALVVRGNYNNKPNNQVQEFKPFSGPK